MHFQPVHDHVHIPGFRHAVRNSLVMVQPVQHMHFPHVIRKPDQCGHRGVPPAHINAHRVFPVPVLTAEQHLFPVIGCVDPARTRGALAQDIRPEPDAALVILVQQLPDHGIAHGQIVRNGEVRVIVSVIAALFPQFILPVQEIRVKPVPRRLRVQVHENLTAGGGKRTVQHFLQKCLVAFIGLGDVRASEGIALDQRRVAALAAAGKDHHLLPASGGYIQGFLFHVLAGPAPASEQMPEPEAVGVQNVHFRRPYAHPRRQVQAVRVRLQAGGPGKNVHHILAGTLAALGHIQPGHGTFSEVAELVFREPLIVRHDLSAPGSPGSGAARPAPRQETRAARSRCPHFPLPGPTCAASFPPPASGAFRPFPCGAS